VRIRTLTTDGRLVSTHLAWERMPAWPLALRSVQRFRSLAGEQRLSAARGRSLDVIPGADATTLWGSHRDRLARLSATPEPHDTLAAYIRLSERAFAHEQRSAHRANPATIAALLLLIGAVLVLVPVAVPAARSPWGVLVLIVLAAVLAVAAPRPLVAWVRYVTWIRPRFR
jgi:hypothetical protein